MDSLICCILIFFIICGIIYYYRGPKLDMPILIPTMMRGAGKNDYNHRYTPIYCELKKQQCELHKSAYTCDQEYQDCVMKGCNKKDEQCNCLCKDEWYKCLDDNFSNEECQMIKEECHNRCKI